MHPRDALGHELLEEQTGSDGAAPATLRDVPEISDIGVDERAVVRR